MMKQSAKENHCQSQHEKEADDDAQTAMKLFTFCEQIQSRTKSGQRNQEAQDIAANDGAAGDFNFLAHIVESLTKN